jgi:hypothetical protein
LAGNQSLVSDTANLICQDSTSFDADDDNVLDMTDILNSDEEY